MSKAVDDLKKIVDQVAREGALTPDAIKKFDAMREALDKSEWELEQARKARDAALNADAEKQKVITLLEAQRKVHIEQLDALQGREMEFYRQQWLYQHEVDRRLDMRSIVAEVFRNFETARAFTKTTPVAMSTNGPNSSTWVQEHVTHENVVESHKKEGA